MSSRRHGEAFRRGAVAGAGAVALALTASGPALADDKDPPDPATPAASEKGVHDFSFIPLPIPISDPTIGTGLALGAVGFYRVGESDRPWVTGLGAFYTSSKSYGGTIFQRANFDRDRYRVQGGIGGGKFNVDFFGIGQAAGDRGISVPITQTAGGALAQGTMKVAPHIYAGLQYRYIDMKTTIRTSPPLFPDQDIPTPQLRSTISALGLTGEYDTRDNEFQPTGGLYATALWLRSAEALGSDFDYDRVELHANGYHRAGPKAVVAWRGSTCWAGDEAPFYDICNFGSQSDLRGYISGQYRDHAMFAVQAEYRRQLFGRWGAVAFAGIGGVGPKFSDTTDHILPGYGVGVRFKASKTYSVNVGIDYAVGGGGSDAIYFRLGEAF